MDLVVGMVLGMVVALVLDKDLDKARVLDKVAPRKVLVPGNHKALLALVRWKSWRGWRR